MMEMTGYMACRQGQLENILDTAPQARLQTSRHKPEWMWYNDYSGESGLGPFSKSATV